MNTTEAPVKKLGPKMQIKAINQEILALRDRIATLKGQRSALKEKVKINDAARAAKKTGKPAAPGEAG
ncbi:hypothetical protein [Rhizobium sp. TRM95796]|uniref:hypothetical protein n=1 Tax=Rhizobium sp. TRM95796 TaxID=2979862 RepID=UPI0021E84E46|nr:hypothetical protein [Rhizobium sp. TRM95796]MCV3766640.1 hypothetical protein [Rhizobium sp. TRM95796]